MSEKSKAIAKEILHDVVVARASLRNAKAKAESIGDKPLAERIEKHRAEVDRTVGEIADKVGG